VLDRAETEDPSLPWNIDEHIRREVMNELGWDSRISDAEISASVEDGVVTLLGVARSYAAKLAAEKAAHRVRGVLDVANDIEVKVNGREARSDTELAHAVRRALEWDALVDGERIRSTVSDGWVTLSGSVNVLSQRDDAEQAVSNLAGVRGVINRIEVCGERLDAEVVREGIEGALERRAARGAKHIEVSIVGDAVTLSGKVDSFLEKRAVLGVVRHTPGVHTVNDGLEIDPYLPVVN
jgi:osmotically-inducible protein OsmY